MIFDRCLPDSLILPGAGSRGPRAGLEASPFCRSGRCRAGRGPARMPARLAGATQVKDALGPALCVVRRHWEPRQPNQLRGGRCRLRAGYRPHRGCSGRPPRPRRRSRCPACSFTLDPGPAAHLPPGPPTLALRWWGAPCSTGGPTVTTGGSAAAPW